MAKKGILDRPVFATVISIIIVILGVLGLLSLPITSYPNIAPPMVQVSANYPGANAEVVLKSVIAPLEEQINGVEGMTYITSTAANDGSATIKVYFELGTDADMAAVNVQNRVSAASSKLPSSVTAYGVTTEKMQNTILLMMSVYSENPEYDQTFVENYVRINVYPELQRINGVGRLNVFGAGDYSIRIWMDPDKMAALNLIPSDITAAIQEQNIEAAPGKFGENSETPFEYTIKYQGKFTDPAQYEDIVIKAFPDGRILKLKDVARVELGAFNYSIKNNAFGNPGISMAAYQMAGSNAQEVVTNLMNKMDELAEDFPEGIKWVAPYNTNVFLEASIHQVLHTLIEAFLLVFLVVFIFLQDFKSTIIPSISALVALVGTLFCLVIFGFTINMLTLFALVLAIGIVVDDAIVVVEAVHAKLGEGYKSSYKATESAMGEIQGAIISISLVMSAVFIPVSFMSGPTGVFYKQFAITLACAVVLSAVNALTLSPVLCAMFIKPHSEHAKKSLFRRFADSFNAAFETMTNKYGNILSLFARKKIIPVSILAAFGIIAVVLMKNTPTGFIPNEDQGIIMVDLTMPAGTSLERTDEVLSEIDSLCSSIPEVVDRMSVTGNSLLSGTVGSSYGMIILSLKDWEEREGVTVNDVITQLYAKVAHIRDGKVIFFIPPTVSGFGISSGFEMQLQDKTGGSIEKFDEVVKEFTGKLSERPEIQYATTSFNINFPQYEFDVNVDKCKLAGVKVSDVFNTLQSYYGSSIVSDFNRFTKYYRVVIQSEPNKRENLLSINAVKVRNSSGEMVPISTLVDFKRVYGPELLTRYNLFTATTITGTPAEGYSTGDAINAIKEVSETLPNGYGYDFSGMTREEIASSGQQGLIFLLCFIFVYLILAAQYESYILPWSVLISLLIGIAGVYISINLFGIESNIYVQVALIMLIGLLAKNGILIVEFAKQRRDNGMSLVESAIDGAKARLRPILMTSFAFIFGLIPLCMASGAGAVGNVSIGIAAAGGMLIGTLFGVFIIPIMFIIFQGLAEKMNKGDKVTKMIILTFSITLLSSCGIKYQQPELEVDKIVRDVEKVDTTFDISNISWREFYKDSILVNLIDSALANNLDMKIALARIEQASSYFKQGRGALFPSLNANANGGYTKSDLASDSSPYYTLGLGMSWEIDIWGKLSSAKRGKYESLLAQQNTMNAIKTQLIAEIAQAYFNLIVLDTERDFVIGTIKNREEYLSTVKDLKEAAQLTEVAVLQAEAQLLLAQTYLPDIDHAIFQTENALSLLLGIPPQHIERDTITALEEIKFKHFDEIGVPVNLLRNRPDVLAAEHNLKSALEGFNSAKAAMYPSLSISGNISTDGVQLSQWFSMPGSLLYGVFAGLTQPIFNSRALKTQKEVAYQEYQISAVQFKDAVLEAGAEVSNVLSSLKSNKEKVTYLNKQAIALDKAYEYSVELLINGYADYLDVLSAQEGLFNSKINLMLGIQDYINDHIHLYRALGGGWK